MDSLISYLEKEVAEEIGTNAEQLPQHKQHDAAELRQMLRQKYGIIPPQLTDTEKLSLALVGQ